MRLLAALKKPVHIMMTVVFLVVASPSFAETVQEKPSAGAMFVDAVLVRPLYFLLSQGGALVYGATLPFTLLGGNADEAAEALVVTPLQAAFVRCLGCGRVDNEVSSLKEGEGKRIRHFAMLTAGYTSYESKTPGETLNSDGASGGIFLGTRFALSDRSRFDVLLGYRTLGSFDLEFDDGDKYESSAASFQIASRFGKRIFWGLDLMGKIGIHAWEVDVKPEGAKTNSLDGTDFFFGVGLDKNLGQSFRVGIEYSAYSLDDDSNGLDTSYRTADLNLSYMF